MIKTKNGAMIPAERLYRHTGWMDASLARGQQKQSTVVVVVVRQQKVFEGRMHGEEPASYHEDAARPILLDCVVCACVRACVYVCVRVCLCECLCGHPMYHLDFSSTPEMVADPGSQPKHNSSSSSTYIYNRPGTTPRFFYTARRVQQN